MDKLGALSRHEYLLLLAAFVHFEASYAANAGISHLRMRNAMPS